MSNDLYARALARLEQIEHAEKWLGASPSKDDQALYTLLRAMLEERRELGSSDQPAYASDHFRQRWYEQRTEIRKTADAALREFVGVKE